MSKKQDEKQSGKPEVKTEDAPKAPYVYYNNNCDGLLDLPVVGQLKPGWNKIDRAIHEATWMRDQDGEIRKDKDGRPLSFIPKEAPVQVRDGGSLTKGLSEPSAVGTVLETKQTELLDEVLQDEDRPIVRTAAEHQKRVLTLDEVPRADLQRISDQEEKITRAAGVQPRGDVLDAVEKVKEAKG
jgi:hypothetical protein